MFEIQNLQRTLKASSVPVPRTLLRLILNATLPRLLQRALLVALPPELGQYLLACGQGIHIAGARTCAHAILKCSLCVHTAMPCHARRACAKMEHPSSCDLASSECVLCLHDGAGSRQPCRESLWMAQGRDLHGWVA